MIGFVITAMVFLLYGAVIIFDFIPSLRVRSKGHNAVYISLSIVSFVVLILYSLDVTVPSPTTLITFVVEKVKTIF